MFSASINVNISTEIKSAACLHYQLGNDGSHQLTIKKNRHVSIQPCRWDVDISLVLIHVPIKPKIEQVAIEVAQYLNLSLHVDRESICAESSAINGGRKHLYKPFL